MVPKCARTERRRLAGILARVSFDKLRMTLLMQPRSFIGATPQLPRRTSAGRALVPAVARALILRPHPDKSAEEVTS